MRVERMDQGHGIGRQPAVWRVLWVLSMPVVLMGQGPSGQTEADTGEVESNASETAAQSQTATAVGPWWTWERVTGDWGGTRTKLKEFGLSLDAVYTADYWNNTKGGLNTAKANIYQGKFELSLTLDTRQAGLWDGGTFYVDFQTLHGRSITEEYVGDLQMLSNLDAPDFTEVYEYWFEQSVWEDRLRFKIGKIDANTEFAYVEYGLEFINSSAGFHPSIPMPTYPDTALGVVLSVEPVKWLYASAGVFDGSGDTGRRWGFETALHGEDVSFTIWELGVKPEWTLGGRSYPGRYYVGGWYHSGDFEEFPTRQPYEGEGEVPTTYHRGNAGLYLAVDQWLYHEGAEEEADGQGLAMFFQFSVTPSDYNEIARYYGGGLRYQGLIPTRDEDISGVGLFHAVLSDDIQKLEDRHAETAIEFFHQIQLTPAITLKPDLQYIVNPSGAGRDALVAGVRFEVAF